MMEILVKDSVEFIKKYDEKIIPTSISEFRSLTTENKNKLKKICSSNEDINSFCFLKNKKLFYVWDTNWYFSEEYTIIKIKEIYDYLNFPDFNGNVIRYYYRKWVTMLDELRSKKIPHNFESILKNPEYYENSMSFHEDKPPA